MQGNVVPDRNDITLNWGLEADLLDALSTHVGNPRLVAGFLARLEASGGLD
ncbi:MULTISPECIES: hypothetical protein [Streptomyces]|uniref:hypothetical protein n=1 Tax=Streptomyces TaxID=1883 RepID=UPI000A48D9BF